MCKQMGLSKKKMLHTNYSLGNHKYIYIYIYIYIIKIYINKS